MFRDFLRFVEKARGRRAAPARDTAHDMAFGTSPPRIFAEGKARLQVLPGTAYARYAMPLDYLPSRRLTPRWGYQRPVIEPLRAWFAENSEGYRERLALMRADVGALADIPLDFHERNLPQPAWRGVPYSPFDALALYSLIKSHKPKRYVEIGSGITTCFARRAIDDAGLKTRVVSIDPEPRNQIDAICDAVVREGLETCDISLFQELEAGDILFFDGSHRAFMNSDVTVFFIDVLPTLKPGVLVHIHDIALPWDYEDMFKTWYWNEQYLLAVYLMGAKARIDPIFPTAFVCRDERFADLLATPFVDLGESNSSWRGGGAMWFTHAPL